MAPGNNCPNRPSKPLLPISDRRSLQLGSTFMSRLTLKMFLLAASLALPAAVSAGSGTQGPLWQEGEILSRRTILPGHHKWRTRYVYRIKGGGMQYMARF